MSVPSKSELQVLLESVGELDQHQEEIFRCPGRKAVVLEVVCRCISMTPPQGREMGGNFSKVCCISD